MAGSENKTGPFAGKYTGSSWRTLTLDSSGNVFLGSSWGNKEDDR